MREQFDSLFESLDSRFKALEKRISLLEKENKQLNKEAAAKDKALIDVIEVLMNPYPTALRSGDKEVL